jgi:hypothetical protein
MEVISFFLLAIMTLVSSVNIIDIIGSDKELTVGGRLFMYIMKARPLELTLEELLPRLRRRSECH